MKSFLEKLKYLILHAWWYQRDDLEDIQGQLKLVKDYLVILSRQQFSLCGKYLTISNTFKIFIRSVEKQMSLLSWGNVCVHYISRCYYYPKRFALKTGKS